MTNIIAAVFRTAVDLFRLLQQNRRSSAQNKPVGPGVHIFGPAPKDTFKYHLKKGNRVVFRGITYNLERRQSGHQAQYPGTQIKQVGRRTTRAAALRWEREGGKRGYR